MTGITELQQKFISHYLGNGALSARRAGYGKGAAVRACNLLKKPEIQEAIQNQQLAMKVEAGIGKADLIRAALKAYGKARNAMEQLHAIDRMAMLCGYY